MNFGAIDIGSNAARVLIVEVTQKGDNLSYNKLKLLRYPIRLGFDSFLIGEIGEEKKDKLIKMCMVFKLLMELYDVKSYKAFATSALRDAKNTSQILKSVEETSNVKVDIISGSQEAKLLYYTHFAHTLEKTKNYIYVDVGGGSTEVSLFKAGKIHQNKSFKIGTVRLLHNLVGDKKLNELKIWVSHHTKGQEFLGIGSGGNINTLFGLARVKNGQPITLDFIKSTREEFLFKSIDELMEEYSFKQDRADVIKPALAIYETVFGAANTRNIFVPKIGLADGMIRIIAENHFFRTDISL